MWRFTVAFALFWCSDNVVAQYSPKSIDYQTSKYSHHLGIQINPLLKQIINISNSPAIDNPFLLKYAFRFNKTQTELTAGLGFDFSESDAESGLQSTSSDLSLRLGYSKRYMLGKRFEVGLGGDLIFNSRNIRTVNIQSVNFGQGALDSTVTTSRSTALGFGLGPQLNISYYITDHVRIGTEATYYFIRSEEKLNVEIVNYTINPQQNDVTTTTENDSSNSNDLSLTIPVALYLIIIF